MIDIAILIIPKIEPWAPTVGPAILKSHVEAEGFSCKVIDLNISFYNSLSEEDQVKYYTTTDDNVFTMSDHYEFLETIDNFLKKHSKWVDTNIIKLKELNPKYVGLSLLTRYSRTFAYYLSIEIRKHMPDVKIIWGGPDARENTKLLLDNRIIDFYVFGDGEFSLVELLKGNFTAPGINSVSPQQVEDLSTVLSPNYSDINWNDYKDEYPDAKTVYITGSRGCVKRCTFCDIHTIWPKYKFRSSESIFNEIIEIRQKYNRKNFHFTDSLINGSMKTFRELLLMLKEYRKTDKDFGWRSQWIMRPATQFNEHDFQLMKESGCVGLEVGLESFSENVRFHMGKKIKDEDMWFCFDQLRKHKIQFSLLMIVGYPTETDDDHALSLETIKKLDREGYIFYNNASGERRPLIHFGYGNTLLLDIESPLYTLLKDELVYYNNNREWQYKDNTPAVRVQRMTEIWNLINSIIGKDLFMEKIVASHMQEFTDV